MLPLLWDRPGTDRRYLLRGGANPFRADVSTEYWYLRCAKDAFAQVRVTFFLAHRFNHPPMMSEVELEVGRAVACAIIHKDIIEVTWGKIKNERSTCDTI